MNPLAQLLELLFAVFDETGAAGRPVGFLCTAMGLSAEGLEEVAAIARQRGLIRSTSTNQGTGYALTPAGARYAIEDVHKIPWAAADRVLSATLVENLLDYIWSHEQGQRLKTMLRLAFPPGHPVMQRASRPNLRSILLDHNRRFRSVHIALLVRELLNPARFAEGYQGERDRASLERILQADGYLSALDGKDAASSARLKEAGPALAGFVKRFEVLAQSSDPVGRGYEFEEFVGELLAAHDLRPRGPFRVRGGQHDGAFVLDGRHFLLETRWRNEPASVGDLSFFATKVDDKGLGACGLFISMAGFSDEAISQVEGRPKCPVILAVAEDIVAVVESRIGLVDLLRAKVRLASEEGRILVTPREILG